MNRLRLTGACPSTARLGFGDLLVDAAQRAPGPVVAVLVVDDPIGDAAGLLTAGGRPRLGEDLPVGDVSPGCLSRHSRTTSGTNGMRVPRMNDNPEALQRDLVGLGDHAGIGDDGDVGEMVGGLERVDHRQHGGGLGLVALERLHRQREPRRVGEQPDGDLRLQAAFLGKSGLAEPVTGIGFEVQRGDVVEHQRRRTQPGMGGACR